MPHANNLTIISYAPKVIGVLKTFGSAFGALYAFQTAAGVGSLTAGVKSLGSAFKLTATSIGLSTTALSTFLGVAAGIAAIGIGIHLYNKHWENLRQEADEASESFRNAQTDISGYADRIKELKDQLENDELTSEESYNIRKELLEIQDALIENYGKEAASLDLLGDSAEATNAKLQELTQTEAKLALDNGEKAYEEARRKIEGTGLSVTSIESNALRLINKYEALARLFSEIDNVSLQGNTLRIEGDAYARQEALQQIQAAMIDFDTSAFTKSDERYWNNLKQSIKAQLDDVSSVIDEFGDRYQDYIWNQIFADETGKSVDYMNKITGYAQKLQGAIVNQDWTAMNLNNIFLQSLRTSLLNNTSLPEEVRTYLIGLIDDAVEGISPYETVLQVKVHLETAPGAKSQVIEALKAFMDENGVVDTGFIGNMSLGFAPNALDEQWAAYDTLSLFANRAGTDVMGLISALTQLGYISSAAPALTQQATALQNIHDILFDTDGNASATSEAIDNYITSIQKLQEAQTKLADGELEVEDVQELIKLYPELGDSVEWTAENYGDLGDALKDLQKTKATEIATQLRELAESGELTDEAATYIRGLADALEDMPTSGVEAVTKEYDLLTQSIERAKKAQTELDQLLQGDDLDTGYNKDQDYFASMQEYMENGDWGSSHLAAIAEYMGQSGKSAEELSGWASRVSSYFAEGEDGIYNWLDAIERMNQSGDLSEDIASFNGETGEFYYNLGRIQDLADAFELPVEVIQNFIDKFRMSLDPVHDGILSAEEAQQVADELGISVDRVGQLLDNLPDPDIRLSDNATDVEDRIQMLIKVLAQLESKKNQTITVSYSGPSSFPTGRIAQFTKAKGTRHAANGTALLGDEYSSSGTPKPELVVSNGSAYLAGVNGPVLGYLKQGDVVYTADETKKILAGSALKNSIPAYSTGASTIGGASSRYARANRTTGTVSSSYTSNSSRANSVSSTSTADEAEELDWIAALLERIDHDVQLLEDDFNSSFISMSKRLEDSASLLTRLKDQYDAAMDAAAAYWHAADSVNISQYYKDLAKNGAIQLDSITDDELKKKIQQYQDYIQKARDAEDTALEAINQIAQVYVDNFELTVSKFEHQITELDDAQKYLESQIELLEATGQTVSQEFYEALIGNEQQRAEVLNQELEDLQAQLDAALADGQIEEYSEEWYNMQEQIRGVRQELLESAITTEEYKKAITELFDATLGHFDNALSSIDHTRTMLEKELEMWEYMAHRDANEITADLIYNEQARATVLQDELDAARAELNKRLADGSLTMYGSDYYEFMETIWGIEEDLMDSRNTINQYQQDAFSRMQNTFSQQLGQIQHRANLLQSQISIVETRGYVAGQSFYEALIRNESEQLTVLEEQRDAMQENMDLLLATGQLQLGSSQWYEMQAAIDEVTESIEDGRQSLANYEKQLRSLRWEQFDYTMDLLGDMNSEAEFLIKLAGYNNDLILTWDRAFRDAGGDVDGMNLVGIGSLTDEGMATMGMYAQEYMTYMEMASRYADERATIEKQLANDPYNKELLERRRELIRLQQESILSAYAERDAIKSLVQDGINAELEGLKNLIDYYKQSLDSAKSLHDYQKKIEKQTATISSLEKQIAAYSGDDSEETRKTIQQLKSDLINAQEELEETQYDRYISNQKELLDQLYTDYELNLNKRLDDIDGLLNGVMDQIGTNAEHIWETIEGQTTAVGYAISDASSLFWQEAQNSAIHVYGVEEPLNTIEGLMRGMDVVAHNIDALVSEIYTIMRAQVDDAAARSILTEMAANSQAWFDSDSDETRNALHSRNEQLAQDYYDLTGHNLSYNSQTGEWFDDTGKVVYKVPTGSEASASDVLGTDATVEEIIRKMKANSAAWTPEAGAGLAEENVSLAQWIEDLTGVPVYRGANGVWYYGNDNVPLYETYSAVKAIVDEMKARSKQWTQENGARLADANVESAKRISGMTGVNVYRKDNGVWYFGDDDHPLYSIFHKGGEVGASLARNEQWAKLLKGELVLTREQARNLMSSNASAQALLASASNTGNTTHNVNIGELSLPNVTNYAEFKSALMNDKNFTGYVQAITVDPMAGRSIINKNRYK